MFILFSTLSSYLLNILEKNKRNDNIIRFTPQYCVMYDGRGWEGRISVLDGDPTDQYLPPLSLSPRSLLLSLSRSRLRSRPPPPPRLLSRLRLRPLLLSWSISSWRRSILDYNQQLLLEIFCYLEVRSIPNSVISLALPPVEFPAELPADWFEMHEVAEA